MPDRGRSENGVGHGFRVEWEDEVDSTNRVALEAALAGAPAGLVVVADHQTAGRGRLGRTWEAAPGSSLLLSVLLRPERSIELLHLSTAAVALAMADAVAAVAGFTPDLKWPNDLLARGRKLAGVLAEADVGGAGEVRAVVVGVGVNVAGGSVPPDLAGQATSCAAEAGRDVDRRRLCDEFLVRLGDRNGAGDVSLLADYRARLATLGRRVRVERAAGTVEGVAVDLDRTGALLVELPTGCIEVIAAGDVVHLRPA